MNMRAAFVLFVVVIAAVPAQAQGAAGPPPNYRQLVAQMADLEERIAKLEGNITSADLVGTYAVTEITIPIHGRFANSASFVNPASIEADGVTGTVTLNADGSGSLAQSGCGGRLTEGSWTFSSGCGGGVANGTWTYANGTVALDMAEFHAQFSVGVGGRLLTTAFGGIHADNQSSDTVVVIASRLQ
jgi:hypothetical protein